MKIALKNIKMPFWTNSLLIFLVFVSSLLFSQNDSLSILKYSNKLTVVPLYELSNMFLRIEGQHEIIAYEPNHHHTIGLELTYKWLGIAFRYGILEEENDIFHAKISNYDFRFNFFFKRWLTTTAFQFYKGFSVDEASVNIEQTSIDNAVPDLKMYNININVFYALNKDYSFQAIFKNNERLKYSMGSIVGGVSQIYTNLKSNSSIYPDDLANTYTVNSGNGTGQFYSIFLVGGYQYAFVSKKWYIAPMLIIGAGGQYQNYSYQNIEQSEDLGFAYKYIINLPLGFNGDKIFYGINYSFDNNQMLIEGTKMNLRFSSLKVFFGMRFF